MVEYHNVQQGTKEWHKLREQKITASNAYILLTKDLRSAIQANGKSFNGNYHTDRGHKLEEEAIELFQDITGYKVQRIGFITNDKYPSCGYSPDGILDDAVVEVKAFNEKNHLDNIDDLSFKIVAQVQFGMMIAEKNKAVVLLYNPEVDDIDKCLITHVVGSDEKIIKNFERKL